MSTKLKMSAIMVLKKYFGTKPGQTLVDFTAEVKALTPEDKTELAQLAAVELGVELSV